MTTISTNGTNHLSPPKKTDNKIGDGSDGRNRFTAALETDTHLKKEIRTPDSNPAKEIKFSSPGDNISKLKFTHPIERVQEIEFSTPSDPVDEITISQPHDIFPELEFTAPFTPVFEIEFTQPHDTDIKSIIKSDIIDSDYKDKYNNYYMEIKEKFTKN